jgi:hypothetical protein
MEEEAPVDSPKVAKRLFDLKAELAQRLKANNIKPSTELPPREIPAAPEPMALPEPQPFGGTTNDVPRKGRAVESPQYVQEAPLAPPAERQEQVPQAYGGQPGQPTQSFNQIPRDATGVAEGFGAPMGFGGTAQEELLAGASADSAAKPEALNKKIEAVKKRIEALKSGSQPAAREDVGASAPARVSTTSGNMAANSSAPPVNRLLEAAQRAVETGSASVNKLPAQHANTDAGDANRVPPKSDSETRPMQRPTPPVEAKAPAAAPQPRVPSPTDSLAGSAGDVLRASVEMEAKSGKSRGPAKESYSSFRNIEQSIKSERNRNVVAVGGPHDRARVRKAVNKPRFPWVIALIAIVCSGIIGGAIYFAGPKSPIPHTQNGGATAAANVDELISQKKLEQAVIQLDKNQKGGKVNAEDARRYIAIAKAYHEAEEDESAVSTLNRLLSKKLPKPEYKSAKKLLGEYSPKKHSKRR